MSGSKATPEDICRGFGLVFSNLLLYGQKHSVTKNAMARTYAMLSAVLREREEISISAGDDSILVDGVSVELKNSLLRSVLTQMTELEVPAFSVLRGLDEVEFGHLVEVLTCKPADLKQLGGFSATIEKVGLPHVGCKKVTYLQVSEDQAVFEKTTVDKAREIEEQGDAIMAFLRGEKGLEGTKITEAMREIASDSELLTDLVLRSAEIKQQAVSLSGGETFGNIVVGCIRRAYDGIVQDPAMNTQKGRKNLSKTLMLLEEEVLDRLRSFADGAAGGAEEELVKETIEEMQDELQIDSLVSEYIKKRSGMEASEKRMTRYIKANADKESKLEALQERLESGGLAADGWRELMVKVGPEREKKGDGGSGSGSGGGIGVGEGVGSIGQLLTLLTEFEKTVRSTKEGDPATVVQQMRENVARVEEQIAGVMTEAEKRIHELADDARLEDEADEIDMADMAKRDRMPRKKLFAILAELGQEICQPLAVIGCSLDMVASQSLGTITDTQAEMLKLCQDSTTKLQKLANALVDIVGMPDSKNPDLEIQASFYR